MRNNAVRLALSDFILIISKATVIIIVFFVEGLICRKMEYIHTYIYTQLIFDEGANIVQRKKIIFSTNDARKTG